MLCDWQAEKLVGVSCMKSCPCVVCFTTSWVCERRKKLEKGVKFTENGCELMDKVIAVATRVGSLYHVKRQADNEQTNAGVDKSKETT